MLEQSAIGHLDRPRCGIVLLSFWKRVEESLMKNKWRILILASVVSLAATSCTNGTEGEGSSYDVPDSLCGIGVDADLYEPLLPSGESLEMDNLIDRDPDGFTSANGGCFIIVDGRTALSLSSMPSDQAASIPAFLSERSSSLDIGDSESIGGAQFETRVWPDEAVSFKKCAESRFDNTGVAVSIEVSWSSDDDFSEDLRRIVEPYAEARFAEIQPEACRAG
jgi:hypothetical protein